MPCRRATSCAIAPQLHPLGGTQIAYRFLARVSYSNPAASTTHPRQRVGNPGHARQALVTLVLASPGNGRPCPGNGRPCPGNGRPCPGNGRPCPGNGRPCPGNGGRAPAPDAERSAPWVPDDPRLRAPAAKPRTRTVKLASGAPRYSRPPAGTAPGCDRFLAP